MDKTYNPKQAESKWYKFWEEKGYFKPEINPKGKPYSIVLPPPNVTGTLHIGNAVMLVLEDLMIRYHRMLGDKTLWLPGTDHAAIATQAKVESELYKKEGKTRHDFSREEFLKIVKKFAQDNHDTIVGQIKSMGASCDWSREAYTLDETRELAVRTAFKSMYDEGLIYQGARIVNWDPKLQTTVSDDEIEWKDETTQFYYLKYGPFTIATARPETKFGDKYVVMHPDDKRYTQYKEGDQIEVEWINGKITATIIKDDVIDMAFGTGCMTITPWHDATDFEIAQRHGLDMEQIIDESGKLLPIAQEFAGLYIKKVRPQVVEKLQQMGLVEKIDEHYSHRIATNSRGGGVIEPQIKKQWFVDVDREFSMGHSELKGIKEGDIVTLKHLMRHVVENGAIKIVPKQSEKTYFHWIDTLRDWCISRQIVFGHRIPVWYKGEEIYCDVGQPKGEGWEQDPDTLDTWFSSGLWTFSTMGWPKETVDLKTFHPTDVLETGYDILFFWVARMILMTTYNLGQIPFKTVYLHGLVRDKDRQKMSKSNGNVIDPLGVVETYGADALRFAIVYGSSAGTDIMISEEKIRGMRNFANKVWNISRFVLDMKPEKYEKTMKIVSKEDKQIIDQLNKTMKDMTSAIEKYRFSDAAEMIYEFLWHEFADKYIEYSKDNREQKQAILEYVLKTSLLLLHPFMPFITEEIYQKLPGHYESIMIASWPDTVIHS